MFQVAYRSSSGALTVFAASGLNTHVVTSRSQVSVGTTNYYNIMSKPKCNFLLFVCGIAHWRCKQNAL
jgi:hypothetical protein